MKLILMNKVILIVITLILLSCNNTTRKLNPNLNNRSEEKEAITHNSRNINGYWKGGYNDIVKSIVVSEVDSNTYIFKTTFKDGGVKNYNLKLNDKGEYHKYNSFGEYYKLSGNSLGIYDSQGLIAYYKR